jgi:hypothetical protein
LSIFAILIFVFLLADPLFSKGTRMRRIDLVATTLEGWRGSMIASASGLPRCSCGRHRGSAGLSFAVGFGGGSGPRRSPLRSIWPALQFRMLTLPFS